MQIKYFIYSTFFCFTTCFLFLIVSNEFCHWFVIPVFLSGVLIGHDAGRWIFGKSDVFDPDGIIGIVGLYFFFLAPLLHVGLDQWMRFVASPRDWRPWLGWMACLNSLGIIVYYFTKSVFRISRNKYNMLQIWILDDKKFCFFLFCGLIVTFALQIYIYFQFGGVKGYIFAYEARISAFSGMGWIFMISESFPILLTMGFAVYYPINKKILTSWVIFLSLMIIFFGIKLFFGGFRGSRGNTIWGLFWAVGIFHLWIRPIPKKLIIFGLLFIFCFMTYYKSYKNYGMEGLEKFTEQDISMQSKGVLLGDFSRSDVQAFLLYRISSGSQDYDLSYGRTYLTSICLLIPRSVWPGRPVGKRKAGTEAQYGKGSYPYIISNRVYGIAGEALLNFGPIAVPFAYAMLAIFVVFIQRVRQTLQPKDARQLFFPLLAALCIKILLFDSDNNLFFIIKNGVIPFLILLLGSNKIQANKNKICPKP